MGFAKFFCCHQEKEPPKPCIEKEEGLIIYYNLHIDDLGTGDIWTWKDVIKISNQNELEIAMLRAQQIYQEHDNVLACLEKKHCKIDHYGNIKAKGIFNHVRYDMNVKTCAAVTKILEQAKKQLENPPPQNPQSNANKLQSELSYLQSRLT